MDSTQKILIMAGGTGGHIFPGLAVAENLQKSGWDVHWLGSENGMEKELVSKHHIRMSLIKISGVRGKGVVTKLIAPFKLILAILEALAIIRKIRPNVVLGMGGFASGPGGVAAWILRKPLVIHEQNAIAGYTNRLLSKLAAVTACAFDGAFSQNVVAKKVGNPIRESFYQTPNVESRFNQRSGPLRVLIIGGSRGAKKLNDILPLTLEHLIQPIHIIHQTGKSNEAIVLESYRVKKLEKHQVEVRAFIDDMAQCLSWADVAICRAGALTVSELMTIGLGAIFVPYTYAVDDHQTKNAQIMQNKLAAFLVPETEFSAESLGKILNQLDRNKLMQMAVNAIDEEQKQATQNVAHICQQLSRDHK